MIIIKQKERKTIMKKITRTIESKKATVVVTDTATLQTRTRHYVVPGSCKNNNQILKAVEEQLGETEIAVSVRDVIPESHKYEMSVEQFMELATVAE